MVTQEKKEKEKKTNYSSLKTKHILHLQSLMSVISVESELSTKGRISQTEESSFLFQNKNTSYLCNL